MELAQQEAEDLIRGQLFQQLLRTKYTCISLTQLSSRPDNFVYRGILAQPFTDHDGTTARSIIVKHSTEPAAIDRAIFEESLFNAVADFSASASATLLKAPRLYLYDRETNTQLLEDFTNTTGFKSMLFSLSSSTLLPQSSPATIGRHLGSWLRSFHTWALAPEQASLRKQIPYDDPMRKFKRRLTYDSFLGALKNYPELLDGHRETLETVRDMMVKEFEKPPTEGDDNWGLIHGDFWSGKYAHTFHP